MRNPDAIKDEFMEQWNENGSYLAKNLYGELLTWEDILKIFNKSIRIEQVEKSLIEDVKGNDYEVVHKNLIAMKMVDFNEDGRGHKITSDATFFFSVFFTRNTFETMIPEAVRTKINEISRTININPTVSSLKISLSDKIVPFEDHPCNTIIVQLQGKNTWTLRDKETKKTLTYFLEQGDCLLFKDNVEHSLTNDEPRSSLVGTFDFWNTHE